MRLSLIQLDGWHTELSFYPLMCSHQQHLEGYGEAEARIIVPKRSQQTACFDLTDTQWEPFNPGNIFRGVGYCSFHYAWDLFLVRYKCVMSLLQRCITPRFKWNCQNEGLFIIAEWFIVALAVMLARYRAGESVLITPCHMLILLRIVMVPWVIMNRHVKQR